MNIYAEEIISQYEHPHNKGKIEKPTTSFHEYNPTCGDDITVYANIRDGKVNDIKFDGNGCAISIASASMLTDEIKGKSVQEVEKLGVKDLIDLIGIDPGPARLKCATLSLKAVKKALFLYQHKEVDESTKDL
jgi:nitrogen fixation protein NifU and related proteins